MDQKVFAVVGVLLFSACLPPASTDDAGGADTIDSTPVDVPVDPPMDHACDFDVAPDVAVDVAPDVAVDVAPDVAMDVATDMPRDVASDVTRDVALDVPHDVALDVPRDATLDVPRDATLDVPRDVALDMPRDAAPDARSDAHGAGDVDAPDVVMGDELAAECVAARGFLSGGFVPCTTPGLECEFPPADIGSRLHENCGIILTCTLMAGPVRPVLAFSGLPFPAFGPVTCSGTFGGYGPPCTDEARVRAGGACRVLEGDPSADAPRCTTSQGVCACAAGRYHCFDVARRVGCPAAMPVLGTRCSVEGAICEYPYLDTVPGSTSGRTPVRACQRGVWWRRSPIETGACNLNETACGGACVATAFSNAHCGACGRACAGGVCVDRTCR